MLFGHCKRKIEVVSLRLSGSFTTLKPTDMLKSQNANKKTAELWRFIWINNTTKPNILQIWPWNSNANLAYWHASSAPFPRWHVNTSQRSMPPCRGQGSELRLASPQTSGPDRIFSRKRCRNPLEKHPLIHIIFLFSPPQHRKLAKSQRNIFLHIPVVYPRELIKSTTGRARRRITLIHNNNQESVNLNSRESLRWETAFN